METNAIKLNEDEGLLLLEWLDAALDGAGTLADEGASRRALSDLQHLLEVLCGPLKRRRGALIQARTHLTPSDEQSGSGNDAATWRSPELDLPLSFDHKLVLLQWFAEENEREGLDLHIATRTAFWNLEAVLDNELATRVTGDYGARVRLAEQRLTEEPLQDG